jgi:exonuclease VII small subunit
MTMATDCETRLTEARAALHKLVTGKQVVEVRHGDQLVRYRNFADDIERLQQYVRQLEAECGGDCKRRRPLGVIW